MCVDITRQFAFYILTCLWLNILFQAAAQGPDISGGWHLVNVTIGTDETLIIRQQNQNITLLFYQGNKITTYQGTINGSEARLTSPMNERSGTASERQCIEYVQNNLTRFPDYKRILNLRIDANRESVMQGKLITPRIGCNNGEVRGISLTSKDVKLWRANWAYWTIGNSIKRCRVDKNRVENVITGLETPRSIALNKGATRLYWCDESSVNSINVDGTGRKKISNTNESVFNPKDVVVDAAETTIFWIERNYIYSYTLGTNWNRFRLVEDPFFPSKLVLDNVSGKIYWISQNKIRRDNFRGGEVEDFAVADASSIAIDDAAEHLYWSGATTITRLNLDRSGSPTVVVRDVTLPTDLFWDAELKRLYWYQLGTRKIMFADADDNYRVQQAPFELEGTIHDLAISTRGSGTLQQANPDEAFNIWTLLGADR